ncbi:hypothetical protein [Nitrosomonas sp. ANs5]
MDTNAHEFLLIRLKRKRGRYPFTLENKRDKGIIEMSPGLLAIIGIAVLTAALLLFAVYKLSEE